MEHHKKGCVISTEAVKNDCFSPHLFLCFSTIRNNKHTGPGALEESTWPRAHTLKDSCAAESPFWAKTSILFSTNCWNSGIYFLLQSGLGVSFRTGSLLDRRSSARGRVLAEAELLQGWPGPVVRSFVASPLQRQSLAPAPRRIPPLQGACSVLSTESQLSDVAGQKASSWFWELPFCCCSLLPSSGACVCGCI